jgi:lipoprotein-anchoring transpeptidase ErfK/SrfK
MTLPMRTLPPALGILALLSLATFSGWPASARDVVHFNGYTLGTIVVKASERRLYYVTGDGQAIRYPERVSLGTQVVVLR